VPNYASTKRSYYKEGENPPNLTGQIKKTGKSALIYKEAEKTENVSGKIGFSFGFQKVMLALQFSLTGHPSRSPSRTETLMVK
jgi:hypothetical protein